MRHGWRNPSVHGRIYSVFTIYPLSPLYTLYRQRNAVYHTALR
ncbi:hypothetical protein KKH3_16630 [Pectobacterium actinidiae]|nr:hypothetical protein KKH3_16630 [Pectobacterium actinidiae]